LEKQKTADIAVDTFKKNQAGYEMNIPHIKISKD
jgi:hypothetical protein